MTDSSTRNLGAMLTAASDGSENNGVSQDHAHSTTPTQRLGQQRTRSTLALSSAGNRSPLQTGGSGATHGAIAATNPAKQEPHLFVVADARLLDKSNEGGARR